MYEFMYEKNQNIIKLTLTQNRFSEVAIKIEKKNHLIRLSIMIICKHLHLNILGVY